MFKKKMESRFFIYAVIAALIILVAFAFYLNNHVSKTIAYNFNEAMNENLLNFEKMVKLEASSNLDKAMVGGNLANLYFQKQGTVVEHPGEQVVVNDIRLPRWTINGQTIQNNFEIVDAIKEFGVETATIFQKFDEGYIRVSTNVMDQSGERAVGTHIGWDSPVTKAIERGERFQGRAWVVNRWYVTDYQPIIVNGDIKGILYVGNYDVNYDALSEYFATKSYFGSGYPYIVDLNGVTLAHPYAVGQNVSDEDFFKEMTLKKEGVVVYDWEGEEKTQLFKYIDVIESYITVGWYTKDFKKETNSITITFILATIISFILFMIIALLIVRKSN
jgi:methyl-accepting chemotaxis protein